MNLIDLSSAQLRQLATLKENFERDVKNITEPGWTSYARKSNEHLAVMSNGEAMESPDGMTWTASISPRKPRRVRHFSSRSLARQKLLRKYKRLGLNGHGKPIK